MAQDQSISLDDKYLEILIKRIRVCKNYVPRFGQGLGTGLRMPEFQALYRSDPFYAWFGLDNPLVYAAHRAAGGMTSIYRQIGIASEELFRQILQDHLGLDAQQVRWSYEVTAGSGKKRALSLDARIELPDIPSAARRETLGRWLSQAASALDITPEVAHVLKGAVFEVRQGYKSKDSKRQNADIANAATAYSQGYLPVVAMLSAQIDADVAGRYAHEKWLILRGETSGAPTRSTYAFIKDVIGYDLAEFFVRHSDRLKTLIEEVLQVLLRVNDDIS